MLLVEVGSTVGSAVGSAVGSEVVTQKHNKKLIALLFYLKKFAETLRSSLIF
jgi:hypothetical protein